MGVGEAERPRCWGKANEYDPSTRECKICPVQMSCREEIVRIKSVPSGNNYQYGPVPLSGYIGGPPAAANPIFRPTTPYQTPYQQAPYQAQQQPQVARPAKGYGAFNDPLHNVLGAYAPPIRVQAPGETFAERMGKNVALAVCEEILKQMLLAVRQLTLSK